MPFNTLLLKLVKPVQAASNQNATSSNDDWNNDWGETDSQPSKKTTKQDSWGEFEVLL